MAGTSILTSCTLEWVQDKGLCSPATVTALTNLGYKQLTTIQLHAFPQLLAKSNTFLHARTGSGKTLAFLIPTIERLRAMGFKKSHGVGALIITPTRELAQQIALVLKPLANAHGFSSLTLIGGTKLTGVDLKNGAAFVVGTPGRLREALTSFDNTRLPVHNLRILILDEADRLLDNGSHTQHVHKIFSALPQEKVQKILVSATVTSKCKEVAKEVLKTDFLYITAEKEASTTSAQVKQNYLSVGTSDRISMLVTVLQTLRKKKIIVFFNSCHSVKFHHGVLSHFSLPVLYCMGQEKQVRRSSTYTKFLEMERGTLLTTGMAERGWDIPGIHWIIQYDPPHKPEDYIHRIGRTGRGESQVGQALLFLRPEENQFIDVLRNLKVELEQLEFCGNLKDTQEKIDSLILDNMEIQQMAKMAFKKFVRAYQCHKLRKIFSIHALNLHEVCRDFGFTKPPMELGQLT
ncbi:ATP-dependent RNA helicase has-1-like isoform X1 [Homarus americanus]|nr:ATP-dependent RNA helicase has-1-like isoform X1 [Homarus americanus]XP_042231677.1 ATP-dependent RNA helicase has-1-like isoform X1 [Homarus americanus]XP_042231678.1 ATP-dependent RNA helicase has-1-like isoform X1 [Homarus americanus]